MDVKSITCIQPECGYSPFPMDEGFYRRARRSHETWYCPAGHAQYFSGESDLERLTRQLRAAESSRNYWRNRCDREARICPWNGCDWRVFKTVVGLKTHLRAIHEMPSLVEITDSE